MSRSSGQRVMRALLGVALALVLSSCGGDEGEVHALGEPVIVGHKEYSGDAAGVATKVEITVLDVTAGTHEELTEAGFEVDEEDRNTTPYYIHARYVNKGDATVTRNLDVSLEDSDGNLIGSTLIFDYGDKGFPPCENVTEGEFAPGDSYEGCTLFLVPEGVDLGKVSFLSDNGPDAEPEFVYWEIE